MAVSAARVRSVDQLVDLIGTGGPAKFLFFWGHRPPATAERIRRAPHPGAAKALGRQVRSFDEERWAAERFELVVTGNLAKFGQHPELAEFLLGTGERVLVEASPANREDNVDPL